MDVPFGTGRSQLTGPIIDGTCLRQSFQAQAPELKSVKIAFATYCRRNEGEMLVDIIDPRGGSLVARCKCMVAEFTDNAYHNFLLECELIPGRWYELRIHTLHCRNGSAVTAKYCRKMHQGGHMFIGARLTKDGELSAEFTYLSDERYAPNKAPELTFTVPEEMTVETVPGLISVVIPHFNCQSLLAKCLTHLDRQSYNAFEVIVVDDGSKEAGRTQLIIEAYLPLMNITFVPLAKNMGAPAARNRGFKYASGEYLLFLDADCYMYPDAFQVFVEHLLGEPDASWVYGGFRWGDDVVPPVPWDADKLFGRNFISTMSLMRRNAFPGWDESLKRHQDWDLWLTMLDNGCKAVSTGQYMFETPKRKGGLSTDGNIEMMESIQIVRRKHGI